MITFGAKYLSPVNIGEVTKKKEVVSYRAAMTEFMPDEMLDRVSLNFLASSPLKRTKFFNRIFLNFLNTKKGKLPGRHWVRYLVMTKEQDSYKYVKSKNILGIAEISSVPRFSNDIYLGYIQTIKNWFIQKYCYIGTEGLNFIKKTYPDKDIVLKTTRKNVKFYKSNGFVVTDSPKDNGLVEMRYYHK